MNGFIDPTKKIRESSEFTNVLWRCARGLANRYSIGLEESYEILEQIYPKVRIENGVVKSVQFVRSRFEELVLAHKARTKH